MMDHNQPRQSSRLLIHEHPLQVLPSLACAIGLNEAMFLQQVHYWITRPDAKMRDGRCWVYNSYPDWHKQFPFWGVNTIRRAIETLEKRGLLLSANYNESAIDRTKWYSIDYDAVEALDTAPAPSGKNNQPSAQNGQTNRPGWADQLPDMGRPIPETNTETNNRESDPPAPDLRRSDVSPVANGHSPNSNGRLVGYDTGAPQSKGARPVAAEDPPPVVVKVPPGTPVNRRPDAPSVRPVPKPDKAPAQLARWKPPADFDAWYAETCAERGRAPTSIDLTAELQKFRVWPAHQELQAGQFYGAWQLWMLRALDGMGQPRASSPGAGPPAPLPPTRYKTRKEL